MDTASPVPTRSAMSRVDDIAVELALPADYGLRLLDELPGSGGADHVFSRDGRTIDGGVLIEVFGAGAGWTGLVANAPESVSAAHSGVYSTPSPVVLCVVARGEAYFIDVNAPDGWWALEDAPVVVVRCAVAENLLVLATPWRVIAVSDSGVVWRTSRVAIDGISLGEPAGGELVGVADPDDDEARDFAVELRSGYHRGCFPFPD
jgi:hypothetical protein